MIAPFLKAKMAEHGMSSADLSHVTHLSKEEIDLLLDGKPFLSVLHAEIVLRYFGAQLSISSGADIWEQGKWSVLPVQENLFELFRQRDPELRRPGQMGTGPLAFLLHYMDASNLEQTREQLIKGIEYYEPRITLLDLVISNVGDMWKMAIIYFEHEGKTKNNYIVPCPKPLEGSVLPETIRRRAYEKFVLDGKISSAIGTIDSAKSVLEQEAAEAGELEFALVLLKSIDISVLDETQKETVFHSIAKVQARLRQMPDRIDLK